MANSKRKSKLSESAKGETCSLRVSKHCTDEFGYVVLCHLNSNYRGMGIKSPDILSLYACTHCHRMLDESKVDYYDQQRGHFETLMKFIEKGLVCLK